MTSIKRITQIGMFSAILAVSVLVIPPVFMPSLNVSITIQTFIIFIIGYLLSPKDAFLSVFIYVLLGAIGLPVFSTGQGGITHILGPTGGFIVYFPFLAWMISLTKRIQYGWFYHFLLAFGIGILSLYVFANLWLSYVLGMGYVQSLMGLLIFIPFDMLKWALAYLVYRRFPSHILDNT